jgi:predicted outer membrane repeat protein
MKSQKLICLAVLTLFGVLPTAQAHSKWYVDGVNGSNRNDCKSPQTACKTIGHAISLSSRGDSILVASATYAENLGIPFSLKIIGSGAARTIVDGGGVASVVLILNPKAHVTLSQITMRNGGGQGDGGGVYNCFATVTIDSSILSGNSATSGMGNLGYGGAIYNCPGSTMTIINSTFTRNSAENGGAICNGGTLTINNSTFRENIARHRKGGGIRNYGVLTINNSTFSGNRAPHGTGGAIHNGQLFGATGTLVMNNSTISGNIVDDGQGGGIFNLNGDTAVVQNNIIANNTGGNCYGEHSVMSNGYNLSSDGTCKFSSVGDLNNTDAMLGACGTTAVPLRLWLCSKGARRLIRETRMVAPTVTAIC